MSSTKTPTARKTRKSAKAARQRRAASTSAKAKNPSRRQAASRAGKSFVDSGRREGNKQKTCLDLLRRPDGASIEELQQATGWQGHTVRGFLSGTVKRKLALDLTSNKPANQPRRYRIPKITR